MESARAIGKVLGVPEVRSSSIPSKLILFPRNLTVLQRKTIVFPPTFSKSANFACYALMSELRHSQNFSYGTDQVHRILKRSVKAIFDIPTHVRKICSRPVGSESKISQLSKGITIGFQHGFASDFHRFWRILSSWTVFRPRHYVSRSKFWFWIDSRWFQSD